MGKRIKRCAGTTADPLPRVCNLLEGHVERGQPWCVDRDGQRFLRTEIVPCSKRRAP